MEAVTTSTLSDPHLHLDHLTPHSTDFDTMTVAEPQYLKMEDVHQASSPASIDDMSMTQGSPPPGIIVQSRPAKKRKSWGQELPQPKTALPPRKRAKTDDEKEQRRIERIKRNRAAAHNSRERKRQETETLAVALARANAELNAYRKLHGPLPSNIVLPEVTLSNEDDSTPAPSLTDSRSSVDGAASPASYRSDSQYNQITIKQEPMDYTFAPTCTLAPSDLDNADLKAASPVLPPLDQTQHSAAMLSSIDLQCQSSRGSTTTSVTFNSPATPTQPSTSPPSSASAQRQTWAWSYLFTHLLKLQMQACYKTILLAIWSHSPSRMAHLIQASTTRLTRLSRSRTSSTTRQTSAPAPLRSDMALAQLNAATCQSTTSQGGAPGALDGADFARSLMAVLRERAEAKRRQMDGLRPSAADRVGLLEDQSDEKYDLGHDE